MMSLEDESSHEAEKVCCSIFQRFSVDELMRLVRESQEDVYILLHREDRDFVDIYIGKNNKDFGEFIAIPLPKRFAVLEPDRNYFEVTLRANVALALKGEKDFHT
ncbi:hypothetical protein GAH_01612 [Geoglobus ahangari]|uniref:Uncharacterized protein n=1 Tax=Geoglobus ahangari TaxID=113653 RepID=A0A0F7DBH5_9EURY|nr:hypothetical protein [Geoglobus ahangari]AKG91101.1 hypothetical protein GAH_01612 [Geoglobus ahangari]NOY11822.1 hypothetical protein [Archaeoglobi archaeon]